MTLQPLLPDAALFDLMRLLRSARNIVLCAHRSPDGDAVGSTLGWASYLRSLGKRIHIIMPNAFPDFLRWIPGAGGIIFFEGHEAAATRIINEADLICLMDFNTIDRLHNMASAVAQARAERLMIDHHPYPHPEAAHFVISHPEACSTCEIVFRLIWQLGGYDAMTCSDAAALYTGMMTDTGGFTYNSTDPDIYFIICQLLRKGIDKDRIYRAVFNNYSEHRLRFIGYVLAEKLAFYENHRAGILCITREEMKRYHYLRGDAEGLVNMPLQVKGMRLSISLREDTEHDVIRVSLRSVDDFPCNRMAEEFFNGGGHLNASGGELPFPLEEAVKTAERAIDAYKELL
jgi:phosphoesterase RecJ-like protein